MIDQTRCKTDAFPDFKGNMIFQNLKEHNRPLMGRVYDR